MSHFIFASFCIQKKLETEHMQKLQNFFYPIQFFTVYFRLRSKISFFLRLISNIDSTNL